MNRSTAAVVCRRWRSRMSRSSLAIVHLRNTWSIVSAVRVGHRQQLTETLLGSDGYGGLAGLGSEQGKTDDGERIDEVCLQGEAEVAWEFAKRMGDCLSSDCIELEQSFLWSWHVLVKEENLGVAVDIDNAASGCYSFDRLERPDSGKVLAGDRPSRPFALFFWWLQANSNIVSKGASGKRWYVSLESRQARTPQASNAPSHHCQHRLQA